MRIELVGGLGVGKSTLCNALDKIGFHSIYETLSGNPFLADCFIDPENFRFSSQMWFILSKFHEILKSDHGDKIKVLDQSVLNIRAYTHMLFKDKDPKAMALLDQCFAYLAEKAGPADLLVHLTCSPEEQLRRIKFRNRPHESGVDLFYIEALQKEIDLLLISAQKDGIKIMEIDTDHIYMPDNLAFAETLAIDIAKLLHVATERVIDPDYPRQYALIK